MLRAEGEGEGVGAVTASPSTYEDDFGEEERYRLIYIFAAWFFVLTGLIEWWFMGEWYPLVFVAAGVFGFVSALYVLSNVFYSNIFNCASINCFFIEALFMIWYRFRGPKDYRISMIVADASFALGSIIELVLCYQYVFDEFAWISMTVVVFNTFAQCLWVVCALIYTVLTLRIYGPTMQELEAEKVKKEELWCWISMHSVVGEENWRDCLLGGGFLPFFGWGWGGRCLAHVLPVHGRKVWEVEWYLCPPNCCLDCCCCCCLAGATCVWSYVFVFHRQSIGIKQWSMQR